MARPNPNPAALVNGQEGWDAHLRDLITAILKAPLPVAEYADFAALPAATSFDRCMAATVDTNKLYFSNGAVWKEVTLVA